MSLEDLQQALEQQKLNGAEKDFIEVLSRAFEIPYAVVARLIYGYHELQNATAHLAISHNWDDRVPNEELRQAITKAMHDGVRRMIARFALENSKTITVNVKYLVPEKDKGQICKGCPERIPCIAESRSTPDRCYDWERTRLPVFPLRIIGDKLEVEATQPAGRHTVPLKAIILTDENGDAP